MTPEVQGFKVSIYVIQIYLCYKNKQESKGLFYLLTYSEL